MMTRRQRWWFAGIVCFVLAAGLIALSFSGGDKKLMHNGRSLQEWFDSLNAFGDYSAEDPSVKAIVAIGSDAVPFLMQELCISESPLAERRRNLWSKLGLGRRPYHLASTRKVNAYYCLQYLGPKAESAIPELIKIAQDESHPECYPAIGLLGLLQSKPTTVVPMLEKLTTNLHAPDHIVAATCALGRHGTNARSTLPRLKAIKADANVPVEVRIEAAHACVLIDPADRQSLEFIVAQWENTNAPRWRVASALERLGTNAMPVLPAMRRMATNESDHYALHPLSNSIHKLEMATGTEPSQR